MKKSRKILLYGFLSSILLMVLCLYVHQDEFIDDVQEQAIITTKDTISIDEVMKKYSDEVNRSKTKEVVVLNKTIVEEMNRTERESNEENKHVFNTIVPENNLSVEVNKTNAIEVHQSAEANETVLSNEGNVSNGLEENLPSLEHFPLLDDGTLTNEKNLKTIEKNSTIQEHIDTTQREISNLIETERIYFYRNKSKLTNKSKRTLNKVATILKGIPDIIITVNGYTDASGNRKTNEWISSERAKTVKKYLETQGVNPEIIEAKGFGESGLRYPNKPYSTLNRRIEVEIKRK